MLVNLKEIVNEAASRDYAIAGFNVYGYEDAISVVKAAEEMNAPVILMANKDAIQYMPLEYLADIFCRMGREAQVPVCVHLDHAKDFSLIKHAVESGFTSVMYDGSQLPLAENIRNTKQVVELARMFDVSVEAEIGSVGYTNSPMQVKSIYTNPDEAKQFAEETDVDSLAVAVGTLHRMNTQEAVIQFDLLEKIEKVVSKPLVIHGSSGVKDEDLRRLATYRVAKVNIGTALRMAFGNTLQEELNAHPEEFDRIKLFQKPMEAVKKAAMEKMKILGF